MDDMQGAIAFKIVGALLATLDQRDPALIDALRGMLALSAHDPIGNISLSAVDALIEGRTMRHEL
jgi:hypothetical protein